ncbi:MAG: cadherin repeat domain-containing protein [Hyphomicrobiales bacterium]
MCSPSTTDAEDDSDGDASIHVSYTLTGGADQTAFTLDASTAALTFVSAPDFENPGSADSDNTYEVEVTATDSAEITGTQTITVNVTNHVEYGFEREGILLSNPPIGAGFKIIG